MVYGASNFSRTQYNESKMGAYYTDRNHCYDIGKMFVWPTKEEVSILEPSIGDGSAIISLTRADKQENIKIFGVELNDSVAANTKQNPYIEEIVTCDFTDELMCRKNVFSFAFGNPPYLEENTDDGKARLERVFLDRICDYLKIGAVLVWVIPEKTFCDPTYLRHWVKDYDTLALYKFRESEYAKWHQIVAVGRKVRRRAVCQEQLEEFSVKWKFRNIPVLPSEPQERIEVYPSNSKAVDVFTTYSFNEKEALNYLQVNGLGDEVHKLLNKHFTVQSDCGMELTRPPIPLKKDSKYLLITSGFSDGFVGSEEAKNLHMMRGVSQMVDHYRFRDDGDEEDDEEHISFNSSNSRQVVVTSSTDSELRILEASGKLTVLK